MIVPVIDEAAHLALVLSAPGLNDSAVEVIVVDGGSHDGSAEMAGRLGVRVLRSPNLGRAAQMNHGAGHARGEVLVFLHADTLLPEGWREAVREALGGERECVGGCFRRRFASDSRLLRITAWMADWRVRLGGPSFGDQVQWVRADAFRRLGGFLITDELEDVDFSLRLRSLGRTVLLRPVVVSSDRRFHRRGVVRQTWADALTLGRWFFVRNKKSGGRSH
ncbi:MAG: TIGR04283 family arsenosugar biosynthesis glycosyltransferase [Candidatus Didemnitutus sp.]|nr:TIGR04283 family arsenosugar biosynthesis glycosyltransferase [Candidatus Didemnitutus sp.]